MHRKKKVHLFHLNIIRGIFKFVFVSFFNIL